LEAYEGRIINLHLGLSPFYRGSGANFWPFVFGEPECVGATIHLTVRKVDAGAILGQVRPEPEPEDRIHELGTKALMAAGRVLPQLLLSYGSGGLQPKIQNLDGDRVFRSRDFTVTALRTAWRNLAEGLMPRYVGDLAARQARFPIV
jgi:methionyl-tRNA formyltransferase